MKKILLAAVATLAMVSCSQNEIDGIDNGKQDGRKEIKFGYTPITRATPIVASGDFNAFTVCAYDAENIKVSTASAVINAGAFERGENNVWQSADNKKYYWPASGNVSFFGYNAGTFTKPTEAANAPTLEYSIEKEIANQKDLVVAQQIEEQVNATDGAVTLSFKHALSQVRLKLKGSDHTNLTYTIKKIEIYNIISEGSFDYSTYANIEWDTTGKTLLTTGNGYTLDYTSSNKVINNTTPNGEIELATVNDIMILLPQSGTAEIAITYSITNAEGAILHKDDTATVIEQVIDWKPGMKYEYTLSLAPSELKITASDPTAWSDESK